MHVLYLTPVLVFFLMAVYGGHQYLATLHVFSIATRQGEAGYIYIDFTPFGNVRYGLCKKETKVMVHVSFLITFYLTFYVLLVSLCYVFFASGLGPEARQPVRLSFAIFLIFTFLVVPRTF